MELGLPARALGFEVRESVLTDVEQTHGAGGVLGGLAAIGCRIAIDDFGTAYSSLRALGRYHVDTIKIDRALVRGLPQSPTDAALVEHIVSLGRILDLVVCAGGVETDVQLRPCDRPAAPPPPATSSLPPPPPPRSRPSSKPRPSERERPRTRAGTLVNVETTRYSVGAATLVRVPYADVLVDAATVGLTAHQVAAMDWAMPTWAEDTQVRVAAAVWIIESQGRRIVVDPAQAADAILRTGPDAAVHQQAVANALATAGFARESIDTVIASHIDGIGMIAWLTDDQWSPFFPNAELLVSDREYAAIAGEGEYRPQGSGALLALHAQGVVTTVDDEHVVTSEVTTAWTGAHSPGHQVVNIASADVEATMIGHLALSPLHCVIRDCPLHIDSPAAAAVLQALGDGRRLLVGPLWPTPGAARWNGEQVHVAPPDS